MTNTFALTVRMYGSFLVVMKAVQNYAGVFKLQDSVLFAKARTNDIVYYIMPL